MVWKEVNGKGKGISLSVYAQIPDPYYCTIIVFVPKQKWATKEQRERDSVKSFCENKGKCLEPK